MKKSGGNLGYLQPAQERALQEEQPDERERVAPELDLDRPENAEKSCSTFFDPQSGQATRSASCGLRTSCSNSLPHFRHSYSNMGKVTSPPAPIVSGNLGDLRVSVPIAFSLANSPALIKNTRVRQEPAA